MWAHSDLSERTANGTYYVLFNALGSTIGLTDASGKLVGTWQYDPWGNVVKSTGTVSTPFLFDGAYWDQATGFYKMGARYYDPSVGRWTQRDAWPGDLVIPPTLSRYEFVEADPVLRMDGSGYYDVAYGGSVDRTGILLASALALGNGSEVAGIGIELGPAGFPFVVFGLGEIGLGLYCTVFC